MSLVALGRLLIALGVLTGLAGLFVLVLGRVGAGHLPGDIFFRRGRVSFFFPIATCLLISLFLSLLLTLLARWRR